VSARGSMPDREKPCLSASDNMLPFSGRKGNHCDGLMPPSSERTNT
jgi:hypothetical protein